MESYRCIHKDHPGETFEKVKDSILEALDEADKGIRNCVKKPVVVVASGVSGPLMTGYVLWCLNKTKELGLKRLYFLSRDGQILLKIAKILNKELKYNIELKYFYASRQALLFSAIQEINQEALEWILAPTSFLTLKIVFNRINIKLEDISVILKEYGFSDYDKHLLKSERIKVVKLLQDERIKEFIYPIMED